MPFVMAAIGSASVFCLVGFCFSLLFVTSSGIMWLNIVDHWMNNCGLAVVGLLECVALAYFLRHHEIEKFIHERSEIHLGDWSELCTKYITPAILLFGGFFTYLRLAMKSGRTT